MLSLSLAERLIAFPSVSRSSNVAVTNCVEELLKERGFVTERIEYDDAQGIRKACVIGKKGAGTGGVAYFGHTDVVPAESWFTPEHGPFEPRVKNDKLYGRGSCDMKGSVACMIAAAGEIPADQLKQPIYITCTADEEIGYGGARQVAARSKLYREMVSGQSHGIIGEPTCLEVVYAHKGTSGFKAISHGRAAHSSTNKGINANLAMIPFLVEMKAIHDEVLTDPQWRHDEFDPPTISWNIGVNDHTVAVNVTPPQSVCTVYFRPMPGQDPQALVDRAAAAARKNGLEFQAGPIGTALYMDPQSDYIREILRLADKSTPRTVSFGTDGVMFGELKHVVVLGPGDIAQAHTHDEWIALSQLEAGTALYRRIVEHYCL
ncbi:MAG: M20 family metallopeptidase [Planctomycetota bacterium]|nr:M20 family metallopeptidase [Planctomycetota bacterium]